MSMAVIGGTVWVGGALCGPHCCLERQNRDVMEPRESPCFFCWESSARRCSSSCMVGDRDMRSEQNPEHPDPNHTGASDFSSYLGQMSLPAFEGLDGIVLQSVVLQNAPNIVHAAQSDG
ncbi:hypothetical protein GOODEAATRI_010412 [Goodea atripinnis]|uniref:Uncharacterized protein n=1 Tax=Goodea atripinnis TaxID=208336 RepID=A0ABV0P306_9TELE